MNGDTARFPPKNPDHSKMAKTFFWQFFIFCKKRRHSNEKLMPYLESPVFFWSPCKISGLGKVWFIQKWASLMLFLAILNDPLLKKYVCDQTDFLDIERDTWGLLTLKIWATELQRIMKYGYLGSRTLNDPKNEKFQKKNLFQIRIVQVM